MERLIEGPVNPTDEDNELVFNPLGIDDEIPFIKLISWCTTTLSELCRDPLYGLLGDGGTDELNDLYKVHDDGDRERERSSNHTLEPVEEIRISTTTRRKDITITSGVSLSQIKKAYHKKYSEMIRALPEEFEDVRPLHQICRDCGLAFKGIRRDLADTIPKVHNECTQPQRGALIQACPKGGDPCYKKQRSTRAVLLGYKMKED